jgi:hypothetical protein
MDQSELIKALRYMLHEDMINPKDQWLCQNLCERTPESELTANQIKWLGSLHARGGKEFLSEE